MANGPQSPGCHFRFSQSLPFFLGATLVSSPCLDCQVWRYMLALNKTELRDRALMLFVVLKMSIWSQHLFWNLLGGTMEP